MSSISYTLKRYKKSKSLRLKIRADGEIIVTAPPRLAQRHIESFVQKNKNWIEEKLLFIDSLPKIHKVSTSEDYKKYRTEAHARVMCLIKKINTFYNFSFNKISIKNQKTRWGSCSSKGNLNFSYKIALLPEELAEYIVAHELCHLDQMNHSKKFWDLVELTISDYKDRVEKLRNIRI